MMINHILLIGCLLIVLPSVKKDGDAIQNNRKLVLLSYNVRNCRGLDDVTDYERVARLIKKQDADFVALQELDSATQRSNGKVALRELAEKTGMYSVYGASITFQGGKYGIGILSKEKAIDSWRIPLPGKEEKRSLLVAEFREYVFCCTHFSLTAEDRKNSVEIINTLFKDASKPVFLAGDLNAPPSSEEIRKLEPGWRMLNDSSECTIPASNPQKCIDYIFILKNMGKEFHIISSDVINEPLASDHRPVKVVLTGMEL